MRGSFTSQSILNQNIRDLRRRNTNIKAFHYVSSRILRLLTCRRARGRHAITLDRQPMVAICDPAKIAFQICVNGDHYRPSEWLSGQLHL
jgi:hypothetical protein